MMKRDIIEIDAEKCNGCGICVDACHEGALAMVDGKAKLISDSYCDGLGNCLPECPTGAITIIQREAAEFDEELVKNRMAQRQGGCPSAQVKDMRDDRGTSEQLACGCPSAMAKQIETVEAPSPANKGTAPSALRSWPVQIKLVPVNAPYLNGADLLIAADCTAYAYANIHQEFMKGKITLIGCPKLDEGDYSEKLTEILRQNDIKSLTVLRMEVPCCAGLASAAKKALMDSGKMIPWWVHVITTDGKIQE